jgi:hypothetical protein
MKRLFLLVAIAVLFAACQSDKKGGEATESSAKEDVKKECVVNFETESGVPELKEVTDEAVQLKYNFEKGFSTDMTMDYNMNMEMMGQKIPMTMKMEANYKIEDLNGEGNAIVATTFKRFMMQMEGPQPMKFDSDVEADLESEMGTVFKPLLNKPIETEISPRGEMIDFNIDKLIESLPKEQAMAVRQQIEPMSSQFAQNTFIALPEEPVKIGDVYDAGTIETGSGPMTMKMQMKYKVLAISKDKNIVIFEPDGKFDLNMTGQEGNIEANENTISGWIVFNMTTGTLMRSQIDMKMDVNIEQMGQKMPMKMEMNLKMEAK